MRREQNGATQPFKTQPVFNNWNGVNEGWYLLGKSSEVKVGKIVPYELCGQRVVVFGVRMVDCVALMLSARIWAPTSRLEGHRQRYPLLLSPLDLQWRW